MKRCFKCNNELVDESYYEENKSQFNNEPCFDHKEHIIQNGLHGKLKVEGILCSSCGGELSQSIDNKFCNLFSVFTEQLKDILVRKDHGASNKDKDLKGYFYEDKDFNAKIDITKKRNTISPKLSYKYHENDHKLVIYGKKKIAENYSNKALNDLKEQGVDISDIDVVIKSDIDDDEMVALHFSEGIIDFNSIFQSGFVKIAVEFALSKGIFRENLSNALKINADGTSEFITQNNVTPFFPYGGFDLIYEYSRDLIEAHYPSHELVLFTEELSNGTKRLYCFISLFSTFQYYVLLNDDYKGKDIYETYYQSLIKQSNLEYDIEKIRLQYKKSKGFKIVDDSQKNIYILNHENELNRILGDVKLLYSFFKDKRLDGATNLKEDAKELFTMVDEQALNFDLSKLEYEKFNSYKTVFFEDDANGGHELLSYPIELIKYFSSVQEKEGYKLYGTIKFNQLSQFIFRLNELKKEKFKKINK
ncbi:hypothetical protein [Flammeovirga sp. OC4]|uniref:hypothetical protein n=1 Tax=Flammeovirga sp. OC4 TaxID=1382345 RepID=UPI0005C56C01|nr:hypothetical protein [Flammeovirga sp. OC4]